MQCDKSNFLSLFCNLEILKNQSKQHMSPEIQMAKPEHILQSSFHQGMFHILRSPHLAIIQQQSSGEFENVRQEVKHEKYSEIVSKKFNCRETHPLVLLCSFALFY